jgi:hypothetical protein
MERRTGANKWSLNVFSRIVIPNRYGTFLLQPSIPVVDFFLSFPFQRTPPLFSSIRGYLWLMLWVQNAYVLPNVIGETSPPDAEVQVPREDTKRVFLWLFVTPPSPFRPLHYYFSSGFPRTLLPTSTYSVMLYHNRQGDTGRREA